MRLGKHNPVSQGRAAGVDEIWTPPVSPVLLRGVRPPNIPACVENNVGNRSPHPPGEGSPFGIRQAEDLVGKLEPTASADQPPCFQESRESPVRQHGIRCGPKGCRPGDRSSQRPWAEPDGARQDWSTKAGNDVPRPVRVAPGGGDINTHESSDAKRLRRLPSTRCTPGYAHPSRRRPWNLRKCFWLRVTSARSLTRAIAAICPSTKGGLWPTCASLARSRACHSAALWS